MRLRGKHALTWGSRAAYYLGDDEEAFRLDSRAVSLARAAGALGDMLPPLQRLVLSEILLGHWSSAAAHGGEAARFARETGQPNMASLPTGWLALLAAYRGDTKDLDGHLAAAEELLPRHPMVVAQDALLWARAVSEATTGEPGVAVEHLRRVISPGVSLLSSLDRVVIAVQAGHDDQAGEWLSPLVRFAETTGAPWAGARVAHARPFSERRMTRSPTTSGASSTTGGPTDPSSALGPNWGSVSSCAAAAAGSTPAATFGRR